MDRFIGCMVSLDCGETLGTYQGQVIAINAVEGSLTIIHPYRNGIPFKSLQVTLRSGDIKHLAIVRSSDEVKGLPHTVNKHISLLSTSENSAILPNNSVKTVDAIVASMCEKSAVSHVYSNGGSQKALQHDMIEDSSVTVTRGVHQMYVNGTTETLRDSNGSMIYDGWSSSLNNLRLTDRNQSAQDNPKCTYNDLSQNAQSFTPLVTCYQACSSAAAEKQSNVRKRTSSASEVYCVQQSRRATTPRKIDRHQQQKINNDCFIDSPDMFTDDFDFEKNLAMFDKQAVFEEIERKLETGSCVRNGRTGRCDPKYRCDENILQGSKTSYRQIKVLNGSDKKACLGKEYITDSGLMIPSVSLELRECFFSLAEHYGFSSERQIEMIGRSASEMVLQLIGGTNRLDPKNSHQLPLVTVLCGTGFQAAVGINCARHLASRSIKVLLFLPSSCSLSNGMESELQLFRLTSGKITSTISELPNSAVDMIVSAVDSHNDTSAWSESWYRTVVDWANHNKARVLAIDPPADSSLIDSNWCLAFGLPLSYNDRCGQVYLCDLSIPQKIYKEAGIMYQSPFAHKFFMPLHDS